MEIEPKLERYLDKQENNNNVKAVEYYVLHWHEFLDGNKITSKEANKIAEQYVANAIIKKFDDNEQDKDGDYKLVRYYHMPSNKIYKLNGAGGLIREDNSTNSSLPFWLAKNSGDWLLMVDSSGRQVQNFRNRFEN